MSASDIAAEGRRLWDLPLAELREEYRRAAGEDPPERTRNRSYLVKRTLFHLQVKRRQDPETILRELDERAVKREQEKALGVARGTHCWLRCDSCRCEVIVHRTVRDRLRREAQAGGAGGGASRPPRRVNFLCPECRDKDRRRRGEREGLERTRRDIERQRELRTRLRGGAG